MESVRIYKFQIYVNAHSTGRGQIYTDHTFIWNLLLEYGHFEACQHAAMCTTMNLDASTFVLTEASSSVDRSVGTKEAGLVVYSQGSCRTFVLTLGGTQYLFTFSLGVRRFSDGEKVLGPKEEEEHQANPGDASVKINSSPKTMLKKSVWKVFIPLWNNGDVHAHPSPHSVCT